MLQQEIQEVLKASIDKEAFYAIFRGPNTKTILEVFVDLISNLGDCSELFVEYCMTLALARVNLSLTVR